jgi:hypothetical protein
MLSHEFWAPAWRLKNMAAKAAVAVEMIFFTFFVCMRAINDYICKLAGMVLSFGGPKLGKKHQLLKLF